MEGHFYPWHTVQRDRLVDLHARDKLPHALLLNGPPHLGKRDFAFAFASYVLCRSPNNGEACGECDNCRLFAADTHPDFRIITPEDSRLIRIEQVRDLIDWASQTAQRSGYKVVVLHPAEQMNANSANALLKSLEEPSARTLMMLVSDIPGRLLPTIRSRCQAVDFAIPPREQALAWLAMEKPEIKRADLLLSIANGAPLAVIEELDDAFLKRRQEIATAVTALVTGSNPLTVARVLAGGEPTSDLAVIYGLFADALKTKLSADDYMIKNNDLRQVLDAICSAMDIRALFASVDAIALERRDVAGPSNPNVQLLFESLSVNIAAHCARP